MHGDNPGMLFSLHTIKYIYTYDVMLVLYSHYSLLYQLGLETS